MRKLVNEIYEDFYENVLNAEEASKKVIECIFLSPSKFGLFNMSDDDQSEFLLFIFERMESIICNYTKGLSSFATYLTTVVLHLKKSWYRNLYHKKAQQDTIKYFIRNEELQYLSEEEIPYSPTAFILDEHNAEPVSKNEAITIMVLALKSCYYLTPSHISLLSKKTQISEDVLYAYKEQLERDISKKIERHKFENEKVNNAYIKKNCCRFELMLLNDTGALAKRLEKTQLHYIKSWKNNIAKMKDMAWVRPSNAQVANVLNIKEHVVSRIVGQAKNYNNL